MLKREHLYLIIGLLAGMLVVCVYLLMKGDMHWFQSLHGDRPGKFKIDGVDFRFGMSMSEFNEENIRATVEKFAVPSSDDDAVVYVQGYDYYVVNNSVAIILADGSDVIGGFATQSPDYVTPQGLHVGCSWGDVEQRCSNLEFTLTLYCYNYFAHRYESAIEIYDPTTCTHYIFYESQFTSTQWTEFMSIAGATDCWSSFELSALSYSSLSVIRESVTVAQITVDDCSNSSKEETETEEPNTHDEVTQSPEGDDPSSVMPSKDRWNSTSDDSSSAEQVVRRLGVAINMGDKATIRSLTEDALYDELMATYDRSIAKLDSEARRQYALVYKTEPARTIKTGKNTVVVRFNKGRQVDFYVRKRNGRWLVYDYAFGGVHVPRSMRRNNR